MTNPKEFFLVYVPTAILVASAIYCFLMALYTTFTY